MPHHLNDRCAALCLPRCSASAVHRAADRARAHQDGAAKGPARVLMSWDRKRVCRRADVLAGACAGHRKFDVRAHPADVRSTSLPGLMTRQSILVRRRWTRGSSPWVTGGSTSSRHILNSLFREKGSLFRKEQGTSCKLFKSLCDFASASAKTALNRPKLTKFPVIFPVLRESAVRGAKVVA